MLTLNQMNDLLVAAVDYKDWDFVVKRKGDYLYLQIECHNGICNVTGNKMKWKSRKWQVSPHMTKSELIQTALKAVLAAEEHEARENFLYYGQSIFDPHYNVDKLWELRQSSDALEERN